MIQYPGGRDGARGAAIRGRMTTTRRERARAAFLGLSLGDAYGRPLEFVRLPSVRTRPVSTSAGSFRWTDDTHMSLYLGQALLDVGAARLSAGHLDTDALGRAIGAQFVTWSEDPLTPSTAPGGTCLTGAYAFARDRSWRTSGVAASDGCGSVMRVVPLALAMGGEELLRAAEVSSVVTHAHPNAIAVAAAGALLCRRVLEEGAFGPAHVEAVIRVVRARYPLAVDVAPALEAGLREGARSDEEWLDERAVPAGDGGWRGPSALGLAVAAALRWGGERPEAFALAVEKAARIDGDSDSVACLVGMLLGAAYGPGALPAAWLAAIPEAERIGALADALTDLDEARAELGVDLPEDGRGATPKGARTSVTDPLYVSWVVAPPGVRKPASARRAEDPPGALGVTFLPGKRAPSMFGAPWHRSLRADLARLAEEEVSLLVSLVEDDELVRFGAGALVSAAAAYGIRVLRAPIVDGQAPQALDTVVAEIVGELQTGRRVVVHCRGGLGRAGTVAACVLVALGRPADVALAEVRSCRPGAVENEGQERFIHQFAEST